MFDIHEELKKLPQRPGVYLMKNEKDEIIYVGKAINLKNRVRQYFQSQKNQTPKVQNMVKFIREFEYIVTDSEMEALILECNLIKEHLPKYNILLKDDKMYPYIKVTTNEDFPRIFMTRKYIKDKSKYYGPITDAGAVKEIIELIHKLWPVRKCTRNLPKDIGKERPCLNYHIGQCCAPCDGLVSKDEYNKIISEIIRFLDGKHDDIKKEMKRHMEKAAEELDFEKAALYRDKIKSLESIAEKQKMDGTRMNDSDVIAFASDNNEALIQVFFIRGSKMMGREHFFMNNVLGQSRSEVITGFIKQFYSGTAFIPKEIILQDDVVAEEKEIIERWLSEVKGNKVSLFVPKRDEKYKIVELAAKNAKLTLNQFGEKIKRDEMRTKGAVKEICEALGIEDNIVRIESFDISNTQGFESVGSMVVFENGKAKKSDYRKFKIKTVIGANDYASMVEVIKRRLNRAIVENKDLSIVQEGKFNKMPDLIMMDGGKIQVHAAENILVEFGLYIPVCGMIKDDRHRTRGLIYKDQEIYMPVNSEGFKLVTRIQDETHRFAIEYHRKLRDKAQFRSVLDEIKGVGEVRKKALLRHFKDIEAIKNAEVEELLEITEMNIKSAESVYGFFRNIPMD